MLPRRPPTYASPGTKLVHLPKSASTSWLSPQHQQSPPPLTPVQPGSIEGYYVPLQHPNLPLSPHRPCLRPPPPRAAPRRPHEPPLYGPAGTSQTRERGPVEGLASMLHVRRPCREETRQKKPFVPRGKARRRPSPFKGPTGWLADGIEMRASVCRPVEGTIRTTLEKVVTPCPPISPMANWLRVSTRRASTTCFFIKNLGVS
ncbi:hypothetical protein QBC39DRAFT_359179 [Podospora conica]|nr:hypothetical protein QBC39DRAFT_359179 [Schizothecium conicum]